MSVPDWIAAGAAVGAAVLVGWQSWETRKSAHAAADAATTANSAIELSRSALEVARTEEGHTRRLIVEAIKTRIDANAHPLSVFINHSAEWPPLEPSISGGQANPLPTDRIYRLPKDGGELILVRFGFRINNLGGHSVTVNINDAWIGDDGTGGNQTVAAGEQCVLPNSALDGFFEIQRTVSEWVEIARRRQDGHPGEETTWTVTLSDDSETGAIDRFELVAGGTPLVKVENEEGGWRLSPGQYKDYARSSPVMAAVELPRKRDYYLSRSKGLLLDEAFATDLSTN
ncbi:hypothetical protein [Kribbella sp. NPDC050459]|uniref:hypothetical protein n=1 Tax=Kribbella sp. NPDC050459 TaxID=3155785 RepID=UPI0034118EB8